MPYAARLGLTENSEGRPTLGIGCERNERRPSCWKAKRRSSRDRPAASARASPRRWRRRAAISCSTALASPRRSRHCAPRLAADHGVDVRYDGADMSKPDGDRGHDGAGDRANSARIDILVNNAGIQHVAPIEEFPVENWNAIIAINLSPPFTPSATRCPTMKTAATGDASSTSPRPMRWSPRPSNRLMSRPSTALPASPRPSRSRSPSAASPSMPSARAMC